MTDSKVSDISNWREEIDRLDRELVRLLNRRAQCAIEIGKIKRDQKLPIYDSKREADIIRMILEENPGPLDDEGMRRLFERIIDESRRIERTTAEIQLVSVREKL
ncbi:MAG: chorismate mutase [Acidobacteria bacterium]|jgi:chorismate mutase|nr:chorismate mutase [Acidobacteriota bacterium]